MATCVTVENTSLALETCDVNNKVSTEYVIPGLVHGIELLYLAMVTVPSPGAAAILPTGDTARRRLGAGGQELPVCKACSRAAAPEAASPAGMGKLDKAMSLHMKTGRKIEIQACVRVLLQHLQPHCRQVANLSLSRLQF